MFKFFLALLFILQLSLFAQEWSLVWSDEFNGNSLDENKWEFMIGDGTDYGLPSGWGNNERQYYRRENVTVQDGLLTITAKEEKCNDADYTSARIRTKGKGDWTYGKFEIRAKMPIGKGLWPALWMMPTENVYGGWAASGEIDITEYLGHEPEYVHGTLHFGGQWPQNDSKGKAYKLDTGTFHQDFHIFALEWERGEIRWFVDGERYQTQGQDDWWTTGGDFPAPFDQDFHLLINLAVGGNWPGYPDASTEFPQELVVDYVRVYQLCTGIKQDDENLPTEYGLQQNYPNPFNPDTLINYTLPGNSEVTVSIYNLKGNQIAVLVDEFQQAGQHSVVWHGTSHGREHVPSGIYLCQLHAGSFSDIIKMTLIH